MQVRLRFTHATLETFGSRSLVGWLAKEVAAAKLSDVKELILEFEQTSFGYRHAHGPKLVIMPEYVPWCLIEDIVSLANRGIKITIQEVVVEK